ncbi:NAD(P)-binding protein [Rhizopogon vinicolor AM-OR11-026]|uniref:NAD(P)-binding protein n=1 Tax=Rhizopogon vinicolor AM-OR11-026 TaxID=1314800 RepID=A0A1B7NGI9_9AGAM|nr:NAD(P)-binding protein [Rhizopogon vinicolor AM-OR11-026]
MSSENAKIVVKNLFNVESWVCVVTGGGTGIGLMIAQAFANNGAKVYITSRRREVLERTAKRWGSSLAHPQGRIEVSKQENHIDLLVNNAGISEGTSAVEKGDESAKALSMELFGEDQASWENVYRTNVIGYYFVTTAFLPLVYATSSMRSQHTGSVINISSMSGITRTTQHHFKYNVSKAATIHLSTLLAQEFRRKLTVILASSSDELNKSQIPVGEDYGEKKGIPAGRPGREEDVAQAALLLACNQRIPLTIDGGYLLEHP